MENIEIRYNNISFNDDERLIEGYCVVFNSESRDMGFIEIIHDGAITDDIIKKSDILAKLNHNDEKVLARSKYGEGTLSLSVDSHGVKYSFNSPHTAVGDECYEMCKRGDLTEASFAFTIDSNDKNAQKWTKKDGVLYRDIYKIERLYDISPCWIASYAETSAYTRKLAADALKEIDDAENRNLIEEIKSDEVLSNEVDNVPTDTENSEEIKINENTDTPNNDTVEETDMSVNEERNNNNKVNINGKIMEKNFSIVAELRSAMETGKKINLNEIATRGYSVTDEGEDVVVTHVWNPLESLYTNNVLVNAGARVLSGIKDNQQIPIMGKVSCNWESELGTAADGSGLISKKVLSPKRLCAFYPVSLQLLAQDSIGVENAIRKEIEKAIYDKFEATVLGAGAGDANTPAGVFANTDITAATVASFKDLVDLEAAVETPGVDLASCKYICSPSAKASLRNMAKSAKSTQLVWEGNTVDGTPALATAHVPEKKYLFGDMSEIVMAFWDNVQIEVVKDSTYLKNGQVCIIVNCFMDATVLRPEALAIGTVQ